MSVLSAADKEKQHAALSSIFWALILTVMKLAAGLLTNSLGLLSEALHSGLDLLAAGITFFAVRLASRPADTKHPYGYGKVENLSALAETLLLLVTCAWIIREAIERLFFHTPEVTASAWGIVVIAISLIVDINRSRMLRRVAKKHNSQALEADALHFTTDVWASAVVLVGLLCMQVATWLPHAHPLKTPLLMADALAALVVSGIVVFVSVRLSRKAVNSLLDASGHAHTQAVEHALTNTLPGCSISRLRLRESGADVFVDLTLQAPSPLSLDTAHTLAEQAEVCVRTVIANADVVVHMEPASTNDTSLLRVAHALATAHSLAIHHVSSSICEDGLHALLHVEAPPEMPLHDAHARVDAFEQALMSQLNIVHVVTHIEPETRTALAANAVSPPDDALLHETLEKTLAAFPEVGNVHKFNIYRTGEVTDLSFHCEVPATLTVAEAHTLAARLKHALLRRVPSLGRVLIHTDPRSLEGVNSCSNTL